MLLDTSILLLLTCSIGTFGSPERSPPDGRIIGGNPASITDFPYQISLQDSGSHSCGAVIISPNWVLTAAHCFLYNPVVTLRVGSSTIERGGTVYDVETSIVHEQFNANTYDNDIALIKTKTPIQFQSGVTSIPLPIQGQAPSVGSSAIVSGWGTTDPNGKEPNNNLMFVNVPVIDDATCNQYYQSFGGVFAGAFCAGYAEGGRDACLGDSGGPLANGGRLIGIVSWGDGCAKPQRPGIYTRVSYYRDWIRSKSGV